MTNYPIGSLPRMCKKVTDITLSSDKIKCIIKSCFIHVWHRHLFHTWATLTNSKGDPCMKQVPEMFGTDKSFSFLNNCDYHENDCKVGSYHLKFHNICLSYFNLSFLIKIG